MTKLISELVKGDRVLLNYGEQNGDLVTCNDFKTWLKLDFNGSSYKSWEAEVMAKPRGKNPTVVFLKVFGWEEDLGDTYAHKIIAWMNPESGTWEPIEYTDKQREMEKLDAAMFG
jgi:hypothetical protein